MRAWMYYETAEELEEAGIVLADDPKLVGHVTDPVSGKELAIIMTASKDVILVVASND
jgi:hypothetical protein